VLRSLGFAVLLGTCASGEREASRAPTPLSSSERSLSTLHEAREDPSLRPFGAHASAQAAVTAELLHELALLPELIEMSAFSWDEGATDDLVEALRAYVRWVRHVGVAPEPASRALDRAIRGPSIAAPRGTPPSRRDEALTILRAIATSFTEVLARLERLHVARTRVQNIEGRSLELSRRVHALAEEDVRRHAPPGLHRTLSADVWRAKQLEADTLARAAVVNRRMSETFTRLHRELERVETTVECLSRGACGDARSRER
jgi:hypothetical protein